MPANQAGSHSSTTTPGSVEPEHLEDKTIRNCFQQEWTRWRLQERKHPGRVTWCEKYVKRKIRFLFIQEGTARTREDIINKNFYYACIYDILKDHRHLREKKPTLYHLKLSDYIASR